MLQTLPIIYQSEKAECGLACLAMILNYYGHKTSLIELRSKHQVSATGLNLSDIIEISDELNLISRPLKANIGELNELTTPCILHWKMNHFVVLKKVYKNSILIHDPAKGECRVQMDEVDKSYTGVALELKPSISFEEKEAPPQFDVRQLWRRATGIKRILSKVLVLSLVAQVFTLLAPYYMQTVIDRVIPLNDQNLLIVLAIGFTLVLIFQQVITVLRSYIVFYLGANFGTQIYSNLFRHMVNLPITFFEKRDIGDIVSRFDSLARIRDFLTTSFIETIIDGFLATTILIFLFYYNAALTIVILGFTLIYSVFRFIAFNRFRNLNEIDIRAKAAERSSFIEVVDNIQTIMITDSQTKRANIWNNLFVDTVNSSLKVKKTKLGYQVINSSLFGLENVLVIYLLASSVLQGSLTLGMVTAFIAYKRVFTQRYSSLIDKYFEYRMLSLHLERVSEIALEAKVKDVPISKNTNIEGSIFLKDISFRYDDFSKYVIKDLNLKVNAGEHVAICGPSGVGKSTLGKILLGLIDPTEGEIFIDGQPLSIFGKRNYRHHVAAIMQDEKLFAGSIMDNITMFDEEPDHEWAVECAISVQAHNQIIRKTMGYKSLITQNGSSLSGGEKQRIFLARALYRKPKIIVMDEATSNLDPKIEGLINEAICKLSITRIVIAHRPQTIRKADRILRLTYRGLIEADISEDFPANQRQAFNSM